MKHLLIVALIALTPLSTYARTPNDPEIDRQTYLEQVQAFSAWDSYTGSSDIVVAVLDTGFDIDHPDLEQNTWKNANEIPNDGIDNDNNGFVDDVFGWDFVDDDNTPIPDDTDPFDEDAIPHGSVIAGVIGAVGDNAEGVSGLNWDVRIMSLRILDNFGSGKSNAARDAVRYAVQQGADVINLSFTGFEIDGTFQMAIQEAFHAGVVVVAAVGNQGEGGINLDEEPIYPACFTNEQTGDDWVLGVAAVRSNDTKASFSNFGKNCTDLSAPGVAIYNTGYHDPDWASFTSLYQGGWNGTSIASPMVAGAAALLRAKDPNLSPTQIQTILKLSADPLKEKGTEAAGKLGTGRLNINRALQLANGFVGDMSEEQGDAPAPVIAAPITTPISSSSQLIAVAPEAGAEPLVRLFDPNGTEISSFLAYAEGFRGGVRLALGDIDGDGVEEIVTAPGPGGGPHIRIFEQDGTVAYQFFAFADDMTSGLFVATGDMDGDGVEEIAVSTDAGGGSEVRLYERNGELAAFFSPFDQDDASLRIAVGDTDGDGVDEIITTRGAGRNSLVKVNEVDGTPVSEFLAYAPTYDRGVFVATGDVNGDGREEIITGTDVGGGPHVRIFNQDGAEFGSFFAYDSAFRGGVRVNVGRVGNSALPAIITVPGPGGGPHLRVFEYTGLPIGGFFTEEEALKNGLNIGAWAQ